MMDWIESLVLGLVQGLTEFLPISSDGHLAMTQLIFDALTGRPSDAAAKHFFDVMVHIGTTLAILFHYRPQILAGARGFLGATDVADPYRRGPVIRTGLLAVVATLPLIPDKLFFLDFIEQTFDSLTWIGAGFIVTAVVLLASHYLPGGHRGPRETSYLAALMVGVAQMFAPLPGVSRSGLTITAALALGFSRTWAVNFSLMMAVLAVTGATLGDLREVEANSLHSGKVAQIVVAAAVAGVVGYLAIVWLVRLVRAGRFWYFSVYLVLLGLGLIALDQTRRGAPDARPSPAVDRPAAQVTPRGGDPASHRLGRLHPRSNSNALGRAVAAGA